MPIVYNKQIFVKNIITPVDRDKVVSGSKKNQLTLANIKFLKSLGFKINRNVGRFGIDTSR